MKNKYNNTEIDLKIDDKVRDKLKEKELYLLSEFIRVCERFGFRYFLVGGSALGAVRHKGFIPWDDDIDVALPRPDYKKFLEVAKEELSDNIFLQTHLTDFDYRNDYAKLRLNGTTFLENSCLKLNIHHGIFIDIFPIDGYPSKEKDKKRIRIIKKISKKYVGRDYISNDENSGKSFVNKVAGRGLMLFSYFFCGFQSNRKVLECLEKTYQKWSYEDSSEVVCHGGVWGELEHCPKKYYGCGTQASFEGIDVVIPEMYDCYLEHKYPNYMVLPPIEKRIPHHYCRVIDPDNSYEIYR